MHLLNYFTAIIGVGTMVNSLDPNVMHSVIGYQKLRECVKSYANLDNMLRTCKTGLSVSGGFSWPRIAHTSNK